MLHPIVPGADVPFASSPAAVVPSQAGPTGYFVPSQPTATVPPHAVHTRYIRAPPPPPARHLFANQRPPQKPSGQVTQPSVLDRVSSRRNILTAEAKPFVGSAHGGQELHRLPSQLNAAARPYVPAGLSGIGIQEPAAAQQSRMLSTSEAKVGASFTPDRHLDRQVERVLKTLLPEESTNGNFRLSTVAPELIRATVKSEPAQPTDEPEIMSSKHQLGVDNKDAVHTAGATLAINEDSRITQQGAADTGRAPQPISTARSLPPPPHRALSNKRQPQSLRRSTRASIAALLDSVNKDLGFMPNADAKPFVGSLAGLSSSTAPSDVREARAVGGAGSRRSSAQGGHELHRSQTHLNSAARPYEPAELSGNGIQEPAAAQQSRMLSTFEAQVDDSFMPDRHVGRQVERVLSTHLPEESTNGNTRLSTAAPDLIRATVRSEPAQLMMSLTGCHQSTRVTALANQDLNKWLGATINRTID
ncbi:hypothetical protein ABBQ38_009366 [Trebouxia sp. C0009 RCD-2024]